MRSSTVLNLSLWLVFPASTPVSYLSLGDDPESGTPTATLVTVKGKFLAVSANNLPLWKSITSANTVIYYNTLIITTREH